MVKELLKVGLLVFCVLGFVWAMAANAADIDLGDFELCSATSTYYADGGCPCDLSITAGPSVDATTADADVVLTGDNCAGTLYVCMDVTADTVTRADCIANTGVTDRNTSTPSGAGTESFAGASEFAGSAETQYRIWAFLAPSGNYQNRITFDAGTTATFTTNAVAGGGGTDLTGAGLFIAQGDAGNTDETPTGTAGTQTSGCTSMANSCSEFSHIGTPASGQNVYLAEGGVWADDTWTINWSGTSGDPVVIGCYFDEGDDDGNPVLCTSF